jgi:hypothetical protein
MLEDHNTTTRYSELKLTMFARKDNLPMLKGKANEIKHMVPDLMYAFQMLMSPADEAHRDILVLLQMCVKLDSILDAHRGMYRLPAHAAKEFQNSAFALVGLSTKLSRRFHDQDVALFKFTVKWHYTLHIALLARDINPTLGWCFSGEDFISKINTVAAISARGCPAHLVVGKIMQKYALGMNLSMMEQWCK